MTDATPSPKWLLLLLQLPTRPASVRMMTWRRLQQLGSVAIKNSAYVLPNTAQAREDFEWLRAEVLAARGQATIMIADALTAEEDDAIRAAFLKQRAADYDAVLTRAEKVLRDLKSRTAGAVRVAAQRAMRAGRDEVGRLDAMELIPAAARAGAVDAIARLEVRLAPKEEERTSPVPLAKEPHDSLRACTWITRPRPGVDRMSSAWLIQRFIDPKATFRFAAEPPPAADRRRVAFDMFGGAFGHRGDRCTFEVLRDHFGIDDARVRHIAKIVHDVDLKDERYGLAEAPVIAHLVEGLRATYADDHELLAHGTAMFAALYGSLPEAPSKRAGRKRKKR